MQEYPRFRIVPVAPDTRPQSYSAIAMRTTSSVAMSSNRITIISALNMFISGVVIESLIPSILRIRDALS